MRTIELFSSEADNIKRFYLDDTATFRTNCPDCEEQSETHEGMLEYPAEGATLYFYCESCKKEFQIELQCQSSSQSYFFELPDNVEAEIKDNPKRLVKTVIVSDKTNILKAINRINHRAGLDINKLTEAELWEILFKDMDNQIEKIEKIMNSIGKQWE